MMECLPRNAQKPTTTGWNIQASMIYVFSTVYFWKIDKHWFYYCLVGYIWNVVSVIGLFWMPESPRFLVGKG